MPETIYILGDVTAQIDEPDPVTAVISDKDPVSAEFSDLTLIYGKLPAGGNIGDILLKRSGQNYDAEWKAVEEAGFRHIYYDTTANWNAQATMISEAGAIYIYSDYSTVDGVSVPGIRIGDGLAYLADLPFASQETMSILTRHINDTDIHITARERTFWNNKVTSVLDRLDAENLVLTKDFV